MGSETHRIGHQGLVVDERYRLEELIGSGGYGEVWRATQQVEGSAVREVALKLLLAPPRVAAAADSMGARTESWLSEVRAVRNVDCSAIVTIYDVGVARDRDLAFISMMLLTGENLHERLRRGLIPWRRALAIAREVAAALIACHEVGVTHCDLKPQNIFLRNDGRVFVLDFGVARLGLDSDFRPGTPALGSQEPEDFVTAEVTGSELPPSIPQAVGHQVYGTPGYIAPERYSGDPPSAATDVYALGVVLYQMIAGQLPYNLSTGTGSLSLGSSSHARQNYRAELHAATVRGLVRNLAEELVGVPPAVAKLTASMMSMRPGERRAEDLLTSIDHAWTRPYGVPDPPYVGLEAFDARRAGYIAGRDADIEQIVAKLSRDRAIVLVGPSGCGKSSLAIAGVAAHVDEQLLDGTDGWRTVVVRPTDTDSGLRLASAGEVATATTEGTVVVVDQLEEVLALTAAHRAAFGHALISLVSGAETVWAGARCISPGQPVRVVATVRDDRFGDVAALPDLGRVPESNVYTVRGVEPNAIADIISGPAHDAGYEVEGAVQVGEEAHAILAADPSALPLVQFALTRWWEQRDTERRRLTRTAWEGLGGIEGALAGAAQTVYDRLGDDGRKHMRALLVELFAADGTRVRVAEQEVVRGAEARAVLQQLVDRRLIRRHELPEAGAILEVVHEALALRWPMLHRWLEDSRAERELIQDARYDAERWMRAGRPAEMAWRGARLYEALEIQDRLGAARPFIAEAQRAANRRRNVKRGLIGATMGVLLVFVVILIWFNLRSTEAAREAETAKDDAIAAQKRAENEKQRAEDKTREAEQQKQRAQEEAERAEAALETARKNWEKFESADAARVAANQKLAEADARAQEAERAMRIAEAAKRDAMLERSSAEAAQKRAEEARKAAGEEAERAREEKQRATDAKHELEKYMEGIGNPP